MPNKRIVHTVIGNITLGEGKVAETLSPYLIKEAYDSFERCIADRKSGTVATTENNNWSSHALTVHLMTHNALEALVNELISLPYMPAPVRDEPVKELLYHLSFLDKFIIVPLLAWQKTFDKGSEPYQSLHTLNRLRNYLVHYELDFAFLGDTQDRFQLLKNNDVLLEGELLNPLQRISSTKTALWSLHTAAEVAKTLLSFTPDNIRQSFKSMANNFKDISQEEYLNMIKSQPA